MYIFGSLHFWVSLVFLQFLFLYLFRQINESTNCFIQGNLLLNPFKQIENRHGVIVDEEILNLEEITQQLEIGKTLLSLLLLCLYFHRWNIKNKVHLLRKHFWGTFVLLAPKSNAKWR